MNADEVLKKFCDISMTLSRIYFEIYKRLEQDSDAAFWLELCGQKQKIASELESCAGKSAVLDTVVSAPSVDYAEKIVRETLSGLPESISQEDALLLTFELESSSINSIFFRLFYRIQPCIPNDVNYLVNIAMSEHISKIMNEIILRSKSPVLKEKAKKEKELWK